MLRTIMQTLLGDRWATTNLVVPSEHKLVAYKRENYGNQSEGAEDEKWLGNEIE